MSRVAKQPISVPTGVTVSLDKQKISLKGAKGELARQVHPAVKVVHADGVLTVSVLEETTEAWAQAGTTRALLNNMVQGVSKGFERKLTLVGVGFRAKAQGQTVNLTLGYSHPIDYHLPKGVTAETPSQTEIILKGADKQTLGQVAAEIRSHRPPEPYKGKGVRYVDEVITLKETKKK
jgi:large subunit ribosomal protein L6